MSSTLDGGECSASRTYCFTPGDTIPITHWIGGWVGPRIDLDDMERRKILHIPELKLRPLVRPSRSQSLYRLSCPGRKYETNLYLYCIRLISIVYSRLLAVSNYLCHNRTEHVQI
jgi:hypothetical protein